MRYRPFGRTGVRLGAVGLGSWLTFGHALDAAAARRIVAAAAERGVNFFDTSDSYGRGAAERALGGALADLPRSSYVVATKCFFPMSDAPTDRGLSRKHVVESCDASLGRLGVDHIDLFQCHRYDPETPVAETVSAMSDLVRQGKILYWGVSQWSAAQLRSAIEAADALGAARPASNQLRYHMLDRAIETELVDFCGANEIAILAYSPLAQGLLTGKYAGGRRPEGSRGAGADARDGIDYLLTDRNVAAIDRLASIAADLGAPLAQVAVAWTLRHQVVASAIVGASSVEQILANVDAADRDLSGDAVDAIDRALALDAASAGAEGG